ncbi:MAG: hypothetical protein RL160_1810 [Bacteroidota bacterium]
MDIYWVSIIMTKEDFLEKYNKTQTIEVAISQSIKAAVQRNELYKLTSQRQRKEIREGWADLLMQALEQFQLHKWNNERYNHEIVRLKRIMNKMHGNLIEFRISHAQKSLGVFFKHMWCLGRIGIPPQCPVDRIILTRANAPLKDRSWGKVDSIEEHQRKYSIIQRKSKDDGFETTAEWELENFN